LKNTFQPAEAGMDRNEAAIRSLVADMPEEFRSSSAIADTEATIGLAAEWVSL
jgi:hypothetical protein